jgi:hypothetical protein
VYHDQPTAQTLPASAAFDAFLLLKLNAGKWDVAGLADVAIGVSMSEYVIDQACAPRRPSAGSLPCTASQAIAVGDAVVQAAGGKVRKLVGLAAGSYRLVGIALSPATADGDYLEIEPVGFGTLAVVV